MRANIRAIFALFVAASIFAVAIGIHQVAKAIDRHATEVQRVANALVVQPGRFKLEAVASEGLVVRTDTATGAMEVFNKKTNAWLTAVPASPELLKVITEGAATGAVRSEDPFERYGGKADPIRENRGN